MIDFINEIWLIFFVYFVQNLASSNIRFIRLTMMNSSTVLKRNQELYFQGFQEAKASIWIILFTSTFICCICWILSFGIVWYERFGSDSRRTLMNKLVSSIYLSAIVEVPIIQLAEISRFFYGPYEESTCYLLTSLKNSFKWQILLLLDLVIGSRYVFGFWLKNPAAVKVQKLFFIL